MTVFLGLMLICTVCACSSLLYPWPSTGLQNPEQQFAANCVQDEFIPLLVICNANLDGVHTPIMGS